MGDLDNARDRIARLDLEILDLVATRIQVAKQAGLEKGEGQIIDAAQERRVLGRARQRAAELGLDRELADRLMAELILGSVTVQETDRITRTGRGKGQHAVIVGGAGRMGTWMHRFLAAGGYDVHILDPRASAEDQEDARARLHDAELVIMATPPTETARIYHSWQEAPPQGVIADIASIKTPILEAIQSLQDQGARMASFHPMFGPATVLLRGSDILLCDVGDDDSLEVVRRLFEGTTASLHTLPIERHDEAMAEVLSLAHAAAIAFAAALPAGTHPVHSTTFQRLEELARDVVHESPDVYYEIQADNPHSTAAVQHLQETLDRLKRIVARRDSRSFQDLMEEGRRRLEQRDERRQEMLL